jgi:hypothetical protein
MVKYGRVKGIITIIKPAVAQGRIHRVHIGVEEK